MPNPHQQSSLWPVLFSLTGLTSVTTAQSDAITLYDQQQQGDATYFLESPNGNCSISPTLPLWGDQVTYEVALSNSQYASGDQSAGCGVCLQASYLGTGSGLTPPPANFTALVVDRCPGCQPGDVDLADNKGDGRWDISWRAADCPVGNTKLAYLFQGSNPFFLKLGVRNHRIGIKAIQLQSRTNAAFVTANRTPDNFFTCNSCPEPLEFPMPIRILGVNNQIIEDQIPELTNDVLLPGLNQQQFESIGEIIFVDDFDHFGF